jgi:DNA-binding CsgD family transcriptional regulator
MMYWRQIRAAELSACLDLQPACIGDGLVGREAALRVWSELGASPAFHANVIESERPGMARRLVGCGIGVFVEADFVDRELKTPQPGLNSRIIASIARSESVVLDYAAIAAGNAGSGLDFVNLYGTWREDVPDGDELAEVQTLLGTSFVEAFAGYRFNRVLKEAIGRSRIELARATRTYRLIAEFPEHDSALAVVSPASAREAPYSLASRLYRYQVPVLRLRPAEQSLLNAALDGKTDAELSAALGLSVEAVKKRWLSIFGRIDQYRPEILAGSDVDGARRGPQKRHRVVAYIRNHREELRPFDWGGARH